MVDFHLYRCLVDVPLWFHRFFVLWNSMRVVCLLFLLLTDNLERLDGEMLVDGVFVTGLTKFDSDSYSNTCNST